MLILTSKNSFILIFVLVLRMIQKILEEKITRMMTKEMIRNKMNDYESTEIGTTSNGEWFSKAKYIIFKIFWEMMKL